MIERQWYGFRHGYVVSSAEVAATIRNFISFFFRCEVCRLNFVNIYDACGHQDCVGLDHSVPFLDLENKGSISMDMDMDMDARGGVEVTNRETALWLWEVHNGVNSRLMKEAAERERRIVSKQEILASKFPTKNMCPQCWLNDNMEEWNVEEVFSFLQKWYWTIDGNGQDGGGGRSATWMDGHRVDAGGTPLSAMGLGLAVAPFCLVLVLFFGRTFTIVKRSSYTKNE